MNDTVVLKGRLESRKRLAGGGASKLPSGASVSSEHIKELISDLRSVYSFWTQNMLGIIPLVQVEYTKVIAKSNRLSKLLVSDSRTKIVGAEFSDEDDVIRHVITYSVPLEAIGIAIELLAVCSEFIDSNYGGVITNDISDAIPKHENAGNLSRNAFLSIIRDAYFVKGFYVKTSMEEINENKLVSLYYTGIPAKALLRKIGIEIGESDFLDDNTVHLIPALYNRIAREAPYLISMVVKDVNDYAPISYGTPLQIGYSIPEPSNEPTIGVIDTLFDSSVYFSSWVDYHPMISSEGCISTDYLHGTEVSSIIVDGPTLNPELDDGCGRFRVRHFGVAKAGKTSSISIVKMIERIVAANRDIKVWNLSLGSPSPVLVNSVSPEGAVLDRLQYEYDVIFVVAGTNNRLNDHSYPYVGAPADSINSLVVNSSEFGRPVPYARRGPVLRFFTKPDVSAFGGSNEYRLNVYGPLGRSSVSGTSFAAPWIARKLAYLINIMNLPREAAKALIIDSAAGWNTEIKDMPLLGYGEVPQRIESILKTDDDEIKFIISGRSSAYMTYAYNIPVPAMKGKYPYAGRITMCYFPRCSRNQGVDYTGTELDIHFGRVTNGRVKSIDNNEQNDIRWINLSEADARDMYRKWDNVKHISEGFKPNARGKKVYEDS